MLFEIANKIALMHACMHTISFHQANREIHVCIWTNSVGIKGFCDMFFLNLSIFLYNMSWAYNGFYVEGYTIQYTAHFKALQIHSILISFPSSIVPASSHKIWKLIWLKLWEVRSQITFPRTKRFRRAERRNQNTIQQ